MTRRRPIRVILVVLSAMLGVAASADAASAQTSPPKPSIRWLAAGDSYSSGEGIAKTDGDCERSSTEAWSKLASDKVTESMDVADFNLVACTGATTLELNGDPNTWKRQRDEALRDPARAPYDLITMTFGGNDLGFADKIKNCLGHKIPWIDEARTASLASQPGGNLRTAATILQSILPHRCSFTQAQLTLEIGLIRINLEPMYKAILADQALLSPTGRLVVVGYPPLFSEPKKWSGHEKKTGFCEGVYRDDATMLLRGLRDFNTEIQAATGVDPRITYIAPPEDFDKHTLCAPAPAWLNGLTLGRYVPFTQVVPACGLSMTGQICDPSPQPTEQVVGRTLQELRWVKSFHLNEAGHIRYAEVVAERIAALQFPVSTPPDGSKPVGDPQAVLGAQAPPVVSDPPTTSASTTTIPMPTTTRQPVTTTTPTLDLVLDTSGLGPLRFGMSASSATASHAVGTVEDLMGDGSCGTASAGSKYEGFDFHALFLDGKLARINVGGAYDGGETRLTTPEGVRVGSRAAALSSIKGTRTEKPSEYDPGTTEVRIMKGTVGYQFEVVGGQVGGWSVGTSDALDLFEGCV